MFFLVFLDHFYFCLCLSLIELHFQTILCNVLRTQQFSVCVFVCVCVLSLMFILEGFWSSFKWRFKAGATGSVQRGFAGSGPGLLAALGRSGSLAWPSGFGNTSCGSVPPAPHVPATACTQGKETFLKARGVSLLADE